MTVYNCIQVQGKFARLQQSWKQTLYTKRLHKVAGLLLCHIMMLLHMVQLTSVGVSGMSGGAQCTPQQDPCQVPVREDYHVSFGKLQLNKNYGKDNIHIFTPTHTQQYGRVEYTNVVDSNHKNHCAHHDGLFSV